VMKSTLASSRVVASAEAFDAAEGVVRGEIIFAGLPHVFVRLDSVDAIAIFQKEFAEEAGAGTNVGDHVAGAKCAFRAQKIDERGGIAGAVADIIGNARRESLFGVGEGHGNWRRKRASFWKKTWMSSMPYLSIARRSIPMPKAKPVTFFGS